MAIDGNDDKLTGEELFDFSFFPAKPRPGRRVEIEDSALRQRRSNLLTSFDAHWSEFAWELGRARNVPDIRRALLPLRDCSGLDDLVFESPQSSSSDELRRCRREADELRRRLGVAMNEEQVCKERLDLVRNAQRQPGQEIHWERVSAEIMAKQASAYDLIRSLRAKLATVNLSIRAKGAYLSQAELLDFVRSKRYAITPLNLANAMAGVPFIAWRQSVLRCRNLKEKPLPGLGYLTCKELTQALRTVPRSAEVAASRVKTYLQDRKHGGRYEVRKLKDDWYYLRLSILTVSELEQPRASIPYRIHAEYRRRTAIRSPHDLAMEVDERL